MTEIEAASTILEQKDCTAVGCGDCPCRINGECQICSEENSRQGCCGPSRGAGGVDSAGCSPSRA